MIGAFVADQIAGIGVGLAIGVALYAVGIGVNAIADAVADWREAKLADPDAHKSITPGIELYG